MEKALNTQNTPKTEQIDRPAGRNARKEVFDALVRVEKDQGYSNLVLHAALGRSGMDRRDAEFASALFYGVIERRITLDAVIARHSKTSPEKLHLLVRTALRMGVYQMLFMDKVPSRAAVSESVSLIKTGPKNFFAGFVNGVLRSVAANPTLPEGDWSVRYSCPDWLIDFWKEQYGSAVTEEILQSSLAVPPVTLRVNTLKTDRDALGEVFSRLGIAARAVPRTADALIIEPGGPVEETEPFCQGLFHVQDLSSQLCVAALDPQPGETVLDMCASPGGKSFTAAQRMNNRGRLLAFDVYPQRLDLIASGASRLGISIIETVLNDALQFNDRLPLADRVLCDVPCSGLGILRRKPEIKYKPKKYLENFPDMQYNILEKSSQYIKAGGTLVYSTCTLNKKENDEVVRRFLSEHQEFRLDEEQSLFTLFPGRFDNDGFFAAVLQREV